MRPYSAAWWAVRDEIESERDRQLAVKRQEWRHKFLAEKSSGNQISELPTSR